MKICCYASKTYLKIKKYVIYKYFCSISERILKTYFVWMHKYGMYLDDASSVVVKYQQKVFH